MEINKLEKVRKIQNCAELCTFDEKQIYKKITQPTKETQIETRRHKVFELWLWCQSIAEIARQLGVHRNTVRMDLEEVKKWPEFRQVSFKDMRIKLQQRIDDLMKGMRGDLLELKKPEARLHYACKVAMVLADMWKKLMPTEFRVEGLPLKPELTDEELDEKRERMKERVDHARNKK